MADGDPELAAKLLAAFSDPTPTEDNTAPSVTLEPESSHAPDTHPHAAESKDQPTDPPVQSQEPRVQTPEPPQAQPPAAPTPLPEPVTQAAELPNQTTEIQAESQVPAKEAHFSSEPPSQIPGSSVHTPEPRAKLEPQCEAFATDFQPQESVPQAPEPVVSPFDAQTYVPESSEPPLIPPPPPSPVKRQRSPENDGHTAEKRIKTDHDGHDGFDHHPIDFSAANWDISAMIQNALGSFDEQLHHTDHLEHSGPLTQSHDEPNDGTKQEPAPDPVPHVSPVVKKVDQKHMKFSSNPYYMMRTMSLASLGSLAIQILLALSQQSREETLALISDQESEYRKAYDILKNALDAARRIFSESSPLLSPDELEISDSEDRETLRVSNLAAISTNAIAGDDSLMVDGHDQFFSIFIQDEGEFTKDLSELYMSMKTQALISSLKSANNPSERSDVLDRFFPPDFDDQLKQRHGDTTFSSGREDLVAEIGRKRQEFLEAILDDERRPRLPVDYPMTGFLDSLVVYLQDHLAVIIDYAEKYGINIPASEESIMNESLGGGHVQEDHDELSALLQSATSKLLEELPGLGDLGHASGTGDSLSDSLGLGKLIQESLQNQGTAKDDTSGVSGGDGSGLFESGGLASLIAAKLNNGFDNLPNHSQAYGNGQGQLSGLGQTATTAPSPYLAQYNQLAQGPYYTYNNQTAPPPPPPPADGEQLPPNQTLPTSQLYERARQAAVAKSNNAARREGIHSTRRAWTPEEERALMTGLDMVKGPHWSQILSLFGPNGSISDILKDRTQVQLKDKARNLKLFFLKTNSEMPYYLQCVTGELKTRAPGQAARKEAEEKARQNSEDEQARIAGIMTLAGGLQHNHPTVNNQQAGQLNNYQANTVSNHQMQAGNSFSNGHIQTPLQGSPAQARTTLRPTTPNTVGQNGGLAAIAPNVNTNMAHSVTPQPTGTPTPMTPTPSMNAMVPLAPRLAGNMGSATPTPTMPHVAIAPAPAPPTSPAVKSEPQDHLPQLQPKPEPQPMQASQQPPRFGQQQQQQQQPTTPYHQTPRQQQQQQPQQVQQPQQLQSPQQVHQPQQAQQLQQTQQTQQPPPTQQPRVQLNLPPVAPPTPAPAPVAAPVPAPPPAQPYTQPATEVGCTQDVQTSSVTNQHTHHGEPHYGGLPPHFEHQDQPSSQPSHHEPHAATQEQGGIFRHHEQHQENDHHDNTDITALLQTLQAATASI